MVHDVHHEAGAPALCWLITLQIYCTVTHGNGRQGFHCSCLNLAQWQLVALLLCLFVCCESALHFTCNVHQFVPHS